MKFRSGTAAAEAAASTEGVGDNPFESLSLPERYDMVMDVLNKIGADNIQENPGHEIQHSCKIPGGHQHGDRNPSASINYEKMIFGCWGCGGRGFLQWVASVTSLPGSKEALEFIKENSDVALNRPSTAREILAFLDGLHNTESEVYQPPPTYDPCILEPWKRVHPYLTEWRGVPERNIIDLNVGYAVMSTRTNDGVYVDSHRIVIPHFFEDKLYGWQSRRIADDGTPKYVNTPDMPKDTTLYNYSNTPGPVVIVESPMSVIMHNDSATFFATFGAMVTHKQMDLMVLSGSSKIVLWFDNDHAGWNATEAVGEYLMDRTMVYVVQSPYAGDPGDLPSALVDEMLMEDVIPFALWVRPDPDALVGLEAPVETKDGE